MKNKITRVLCAHLGIPGLFLFFLISTPAFADELNCDLLMRQNHIDSIQKALSWEDQNILYERYGGFKWQSSKDILASHKASCQGYASINYEILQRLGFEPSIFVFQTKVSFEGPTHAVVIFKNGEYFNAVSNHTLIHSTEVTLEAFMYYLALRYDLHFPTRRTLL